MLYPGYIASEMNERVQQQVTFMVSTEKGVQAMVDAIEKEKATPTSQLCPGPSRPGHEARPATAPQAPALTRR